MSPYFMQYLLTGKLTTSKAQTIWSGKSDARFLLDGVDCIFIARQHTDARYWYSNSVRQFVCLSVRLSRSCILWKRLNILS